jgi:hypothetical protein
MPCPSKMIDLHLSAFAPRWRFLYAVRIDAYDEETKTALAEMAKEKDIPLSQFIREAIKWYVAQFNNKEK